MKSKLTLNLYRKIRHNLPDSEFLAIKGQLLILPEKELLAFWMILSAGYPVRFALLNCGNLWSYMYNKNISWKEALKTIYSIYPGVNMGIFIKRKEWFELN